MRLIDADVLEAMGYELQRTYQKDANTMIYEVKKIGEIQTIEAEPVRHGRWIDTGSGQECSVCHEIQYGYDNYRYYCQFCGARMKNE